MLSDKEKKILAALESHATIKDAADELNRLGLTVGATYKWLQRLRKRFRASQVLVNQIYAYRRKGGILAKILYAKVGEENEVSF